MAFIPSAAAQRIVRKTNIEPNLILEIDGIPIIFGSRDILVDWQFDDGFFFDSGLFFDTPVPDPNSRDYISLQGTSRSISNQVLPDKSGTSSTLTMKIKLIDYKGEVTEILKSNNNVEDLLGKRASVYVGFRQLSHPENSIPIMDGNIQSIEPEHGAYMLQIAHSENKKRQEIFETYTSQLSGAIDDTTVTIPVDSTANLFTSADAMTSYIRIDDEIMEVVSIDSAIQLTVIRSRLNTIAASHDLDADVASVYELTGDAINLALKLYISGGDEFYQDLTPTSFLDLGSENVANAIYFKITNVNDLNVQIGDSISVTGATNAENNGTFTITDIEEFESGSYIVCQDAGFVLESVTSALVQFKSQYNVLSEGLGLTPFDVDINNHQNEFALNSASLPEYTFYLGEEINGKDFVDAELYFPSGIYSIIRGAKIGCKFTRAPLSSEGTVLFNSSNIIDITKIKTQRTTARFRYNSVVYKFEKSVRDGEFKAGVINVNPTAQARIDNTRDTLKIESTGLRRQGDTTSLIERQTNRFYQRYQYGATIYKGVKVLFQDAFNLEIGDVIEFGGTDVLIPDLTAGTTYTPRKFLEIISKKQDIISGVISFDCLETGFDLNARYGVISPSSFITSNSTTTELELELSFFTGQVVTEREKWEGFVGERIRVRSEDYTFDEIVTIDSLSNTNEEVLVVTPALSMAPVAGWLVEIPQYDESDASIDAAYKARFTYNNYEDTIVSVTNDSTFEVNEGSQYEAGMFIQVRSQDYTNDTGDFGVEIASVSTNTITLLEDLPFTPAIGDAVFKLNWKDAGQVYRFI